MESFRPQGTCTRQILFNVNDNGILTDLKFMGGCSGGQQLLIRICIGKPISEVIELCANIKCKNGSSCPEQLSNALIDYEKAKQSQDLGENAPHRGHPRVLPVH